MSDSLLAGASPEPWLFIAPEAIYWGPKLSADFYGEVIKRNEVV